MFKHMIPKKGDEGILEKPAPVGFIFEPKFDGTRIFLYKDKENLSLVNELGIDILFKFPEMLDIPAYIKLEKCVLDGVIVALKESIPNSEALQARELLEPEKSKIRRKRFPAVFFVFDILEANKVLLTNELLKKRREILEKSIKESDIIKICPSSLTSKVIWEKVKEGGYEGVIAKALGSRYWPGKTWDWLKIINFHTQNAIITGVTEKTFLLSAYKNGALQDLGMLEKNGFLKKYIKKRICDLETEKKPFDIDIKARWLKPEIIIKVKHDGFQENKLKNPKFMRIRFDRLPEQCVIENEI